MALKHVYLVKMNLYIYSTRNLLPYPMWDITNTPHADTTSSLCHMGLRGQTDKHPLRSQTNPHTGVGELGSDTTLSCPKTHSKGMTVISHFKLEDL